MEEKLRDLTFGQAIVIGLVLAGLYFVIGYDNGDSIKNRTRTLEQQLKTKEAKLKQINIDLAEAEKYKQIIKQLGDQIEVIYKAIPKDLSAVQVRKLISNEARDVGLNIIEINEERSMGRSNKNDGDFISSIDIGVKLEGHYAQMMMLLSNLSKTKKVIKVQKLEISKAQSKNKKSLDDSENPILKFNANLSAYKYVDESSKK